MALNVLRQVTSNKCISPTITTLLRKASNLYTPDYLEAPLDETKIHKELYIRLEGFDYPIIEKYQSFITKTSRAMGFDVGDSFALPHKELEVERYKPDTEVVHSKYTIKLYQRILRFNEVEASKVGSWIRVLEASLPRGVQLLVDNYKEDIDKKRYIPNQELVEMKALLDEKMKADGSEP